MRLLTREPGHQLLVWWVLAGLASGLLVPLTGAGVLVIGYGVLALVLGLPQWLVLRQILRPASWWLVVTILGTMLGWNGATALRGSYLVNVGPGTTISESAFAAVFWLTAALAGAIVGAAQWLLLRRFGRRSLA